MKKLSLAALITVLTIIPLSVFLAGPGRGGGAGCAGLNAAQLDNIPVGTLTEIETTNLVQIRENVALLPGRCGDPRKAHDQRTDGRGGQR